MERAQPHRIVRAEQEQAERREPAHTHPIVTLLPFGFVAVRGAGAGGPPTQPAAFRRLADEVACASNAPGRHRLHEDGHLAVVVVVAPREGANGVHCVREEPERAGESRREPERAGERRRFSEKRGRRIRAKQLKYARRRWRRKRGRKRGRKRRPRPGL